MKIDLLADTNFLIYLHEGKSFIEPFLDYYFAISFVSEIEILSFKNNKTEDIIYLKSLIKDCYSIGIEDEIKNETIDLKRKFNIKLPDAIIAATSIVYNIPLVTSDQDFKKIKKLDLIYLDNKH
jgi:hypothetical protein